MLTSRCFLEDDDLVLGVSPLLQVNHACILRNTEAIDLINNTLDTTQSLLLLCLCSSEHCAVAQMPHEQSLITCTTLQAKNIVMPFVTARMDPCPLRLHKSWGNAVHVISRLRHEVR